VESLAAEAAPLLTSRSSEEWGEGIAKDDAVQVGMGGATAEDAAEFAAAMATDEVIEAMDEDAHQAAVVAAAEAAAEAIMDAPTAALAARPALRLTQERKDRLDALGFVWSLRSKRIEDHWDLMFRQLVEYKQKHGDCLVPSRFEENPKLGKWVETQRYEYTKLQRAANGTPVPAPADAKETKEESDVPNLQDKPRASHPRLTEERLQRLNSIGFEWSKNFFLFHITFTEIHLTQAH